MAQTNEPGGEGLGDQNKGAPNLPIKSRIELKKFFSNGCLPDQTAFEYLIDSLAHRNDFWKKPEAGGGSSGESNVGVTHRISALNRSWYVYVDSQNNLVVAESDAVRLRLNANDRVDIGEPADPFALQVKGLAGIGMRMGVYDPGDNTRKEFPSSALTGQQVPADGGWHPILSGLSSCQAFEVVASASGASTSRNHALTHAIAVTAASGGSKSIQHTYSYDGWYWRRKIHLKWQASGGWFAKNPDYSLCVRTGLNYGKSDDGKPVMIRYHMTRLW
jgi:hypothetical protein